MSCQNSTITRKCNNRTLAEKAEAVYELDNKKTTRAKVRAKLNVVNSTITNWLYNRDTIMKYFDCDKYMATIKREKKPQNPELEKGLKIWFDEAYKKLPLTHIPVTKSLLLSEARILNKNNVGKAIVSQSYIDGFMKRNGLSCIVLHGEASSVGTVNLKPIQDVMSQYEPKYIFNMDETSLFYQQLPQKCVVKNVEKSDFRGFKMSKQRISIAVTVNMDNSVYIPLLFIGKAKKPNCFSDVPKCYTSQHHAWMDSTVFIYWIDEIFMPAVTSTLGDSKILLIMDNFSGHPKELSKEKYKNLEIIYLPPNTTAKLQPLDQGIISALKGNYKTSILNECVKTIDNFEEIRRIKVKNGMGGLKFGKTPNIADSIVYMTTVFNEMKSSTVINCWKQSTIPTVTQMAKLERVLELLPPEEDHSVKLRLALADILEKIKVLNPINSKSTFITGTSLYSVTRIEDLCPFMHFEESPAFQVSVINDTSMNITENIIDNDKKEELMTTKFKRKLNKLYRSCCNMNDVKKQRISKCFDELKTNL